MKKMLLVALLAMTTQGTAVADVLVGVLNLQKVLVSINEGKSINDELKKVFEDKKAILSKEEQKLKKEQEEYVKQSALLSADARQKKEGSLQQGIAGLQKKTMDYQKEISELEANLKKPLLEKVKAIVDKVSADEKVEFTVELNSSPVLYAKTKKDITDLVIEKYNKEHPGKGGKK